MAAGNVVWVDIPVENLDRAIKFYSAVLGTTVKKEEFQGGAMGLLPHEGQSVGGCLTKSDESKPSQNGTTIYLSVQGRLDEAQAIAAKEGGKVLIQKHQIGPHGYRAVILDSEGNRIALHSM
jgi:uncharacterized protein